jgi:hypothetical protein
MGLFLNLGYTDISKIDWTSQFLLELSPTDTNLEKPFSST